MNRRRTVLIIAGALLVLGLTAGLASSVDFRQRGRSVLDRVRRRQHES
jgi:hypothetical protein